jgi:hypothetical protein
VEHLGGEGGFTLLESMVALSVFTITLIPTSSVFLGGLQAASVGNVRSDAVGLAASTLADVQALPYNEVGFYDIQPNYVSVCPASVSLCAGEPTVDLVHSGSFDGTVPPGAFAPVSTQTVGSTTFTITTYITWADAAVPSGTCVSQSTTCAGAYPQVTVVVSWGGLLAGSVTESTIVYPGGQGKWTAAGSSRGQSTSCPSTPVEPAEVTATSTSTPSTSVSAQVTVSWSAEPTASQPCYYVVDEATSSGALPTTCSEVPGAGFEANPWQPGTASSYTVTGLSWNTTYWFAVVAYSSGGAQCSIGDAAQPVTTPSSPSGSTCTVTSLSVTAVPSNSTAKTYENSSGQMTDDLDLVASTTGTCSGVTVQSELVNSSTQDPGSPYTLSPGAGGQFDGTVDSQGVAWTTGQHVLTAYLGGLPTPQQQSIEVCAASGEKTNNPNSCP